MTTYLANGNPTIATVLMALSTFKFSTLSVNRILLSFNSEEAATNFLEEIRSRNAVGSNLEGNNVVVMPDYGIIDHAAVVIYHAVNSYKEQLISVNEFDLRAHSEEEKNLLKEIEQYIKKHFGSDAITVK
ncbi:hypothetical protein [Tolypothrix sp. VBCCA 56010]|uniref:hypothetical protein n=1 Tax=Tolypothrix sp. VBCCA 56010 TaxID=3137731 RepID=UPI003D7CA40F